jgi:hypothetical protein
MILQVIARARTVAQIHTSNIAYSTVTDSRRFRRGSPQIRICRHFLVGALVCFLPLCPPFCPTRHFISFGFRCLCLGACPILGRSDAGLSRARSLRLPVFSYSPCDLLSPCDPKRT